MFQDVFVFFILVLNIIFNTAGHIALKKSTAVGEGGTVLFWKLVTARPSFVIGLVCFVVEFALWLSFLSWLTLSEAMLIGMINTVCIVLAGRLFFDERITLLRLVGIILIIVGVGIVGMKNA